jgi:hypothetical protein
MDDLAGLDWSKDSSSQKPSRANYNYNFNPSSLSTSTLKPTPPVSGRATPVNNTSSLPPSKPATPANDSFANLVSWSGSSSNANLSLQEQQKRLTDLKLQQTKAPTAHHGAGDEAFWTNLESGRASPAIAQKNGAAPASKPVQDEDDIFAAFNASGAGSKDKISNSQSQKQSAPQEDDDPFGLSEFQHKSSQRTDTTMTVSTNDDDDVLGLLGRPIDRNKPRPDIDVEPSKPQHDSEAHPQDKAVAELVDMGFPAEKARRALETTESGTDVQAAVGFLLNSAHQEARDRSRSQDPAANGRREERPQRMDVRGNPPSRRQAADEEDLGSRRRKQQDLEKDPSQIAAEIGSNFFKTANSFWKQSTKKVQQAMQEFNSDSDTGGQPKWMREAAMDKAKPSPEGADDPAGRRQRGSSAGKRREEANVTDEAMMLEAQRPTPPPSRQMQRRPEGRFDSSADTSRDHSPAVPSRLRESASPQPAFLRQQPKQAQPATSSRTSLSRQANEDQAAQAYVSSARRRKPAAAASEPDLFTAPEQAAPQRPVSSRPAPKILPKPTPIATRPPPPKRNIPTIPPLSLKASHTAREAGNAHFKRGDYSSAHSSYNTSLNHLPKGHPLTLVLLTNHALTALKIGEPKTAIVDCDTAITLIGVSKGESESIDFSDGSPAKPMRDYYGKAIMRKAEALEQMEKWSEAATVWKEAVESGHGGAASMQGRLRAERAANPPPKPKPKAAFAAPAARKTPVRRPAVAAGASGDSAAVSRLRAANAAADRADDEKFALGDAVDARINTWRNGKQDNLRALLGSLDTVLWPEAGWKKISMADLVLPGKVKIQYMKGIGKVHPDKASLARIYGV